MPQRAPIDDFLHHYYSAPGRCFCLGAQPPRLKPYLYLGRLHKPAAEKLGRPVWTPVVAPGDKKPAPIC
jgi:hypothetical protein